MKRALVQTLQFVFMAMTSAAVADSQTKTRGFVLEAGYYSTNPGPRWFAAGQVVTLFLNGVGESLSDTVSATGLPLPSTLGGISVTLRRLSATFADVPLFQVRRLSACNTPEPVTDCGTITAITLQVPYRFRLPTSQQFPGDYSLRVWEGGQMKAEVEFTLLPMKPHIIRAQDNVFAMSGEFTARPAGPAVKHSDGSWVTAENPARLGQIVSLWAVGLGDAYMGEKAGEPAPAGITVTPGLTIEFGDNLPAAQLDFVPGASTPRPPSLIYAGLVPGQVGIYQVNFKVPETAPEGTPRCGVAVQSNATVTIGTYGYAGSDAVGLCVDFGAEAQ